MTKLVLSTGVKEWRLTYSRSNRKTDADSPLRSMSGSRANNWAIVLGVVLINGSLLWLFGRNVIHVGASGLIFGLIAFLIVSGMIEKRLVPLAISLLVGLLYGGTLLTGVIPRWGSDVSWDGHLCGVIAGVLVAYALTRYTK